MHITSVEHGYYGSYAIVGAHLPIATGLAWAAKIKRTGQVTVCFFGDGATNIGAFHEAVNLAAIWRLPVVFVCENNQYMEYTPIGEVIPIELPAADRAAAYGLDRIVVDGNDVDAVRQVVGAAVAVARDGQGPSLIEAETYRLKGHSAADAAGVPPGRGGGAAGGSGTRCCAPGGARPGRDRPGQARRDRRATKVRAHRTGRARCWPGPRRTAGRGLDRPVERRGLAMAQLTLPAGRAGRAGPGDAPGRAGRAARRGRRLRRGVQDHHRAARRFGADRVWDTPISEQAIVGAAMGAAMAGLRPVAEIMFADFYATCWDQVVNEIAKTGT